MQSKLCGNHGQFVEAPILTICFSRRVNLYHMQSQLCGNHGKFVEAPIPTICFSRRVNIYHMQSQLCGNHGQFLETPIPDIEEALAFPDVSAPVTWTLSFTEMIGAYLCALVS
ncbi:hypothetical protein ACFX1R_008102 [Malus domestica]